MTTETQQAERYIHAQTHTVSLPGPFANMREVVRANTESGRGWFEPASMKYHRSVVNGALILGCLFVTGERWGIPEDNMRRYTVRAAKYPDGTISNVSQFGAFDTAAEARAWIFRNILSTNPGATE